MDDHRLGAFLAALCVGCTGPGATCGTRCGDAAWGLDASAPAIDAHRDSSSTGSLDAFASNPQDSGATARPDSGGGASELDSGGATTDVDSGVVVPTGPVSRGADSVVFTNTFQNVARLDSAPLATEAGSTIFAVVAMGTLANMQTPFDEQGNTYEALLPPHNYQNWSQSGQQLFAARNIRGGAGLIVHETMPEPNDEVTLSVLEVRGGSRIADVSVTETPSVGPVTSGSVTTTGPALIAAWWWGDGAATQVTATTSSGFERVHSLSRAQGYTGLIQMELATMQVSSAGTYSITWTTDPDQGAVSYVVAIE
jgi:hypothetical protein